MSKNVIEAVLGVHINFTNSAKHGKLSAFQLSKHKDIVVSVVDESSHVKVFFSHSHLAEEMVEAYSAIPKLGGEMLRIVELGKVYVDMRTVGGQHG